MNQVEQPRPPAGSSAESRRRAALAAEFVRSCPLALGQEIAITGSVARGVADMDSDIELNFWTETLPSREERERWLCAADTEAPHPDMPDADGTVWATVRLQGTWIEAGWQTIGAQEELLRGILAGEVLSHDRFVVADATIHAVPLRSGGLLANWQRQLSQYPEALRERVIADNTAVWQMPHAVGGRWTLCRRSDEPALTQRLLWGFANIWSLLFALNRRWEPDRKWLHQNVAELTIAPEHFADRVYAIFGSQPSEQRVAICFELILDTLALLPPSPGVQRAAETIRASLEAHRP